MEGTGSESALLARAEAAYKEGRVDDAVNLFDELTRSEHYSHEGHYGLGLILLHLKRYSEAIDRFEKAARAGGRADNAWYYIGQTEEARGKYGAALRAYRKARRLNREHAAAARNIERLEAQRRIRQYIGWRAPLPLRILIFVFAVGLIALVGLTMLGVIDPTSLGIGDRDPEIRRIDSRIEPIG